MPVRLLRPGLTTSERFNACDWFTQSFYVRLLTLVDDFGRYDANPRLIKSHAFPLSDDVTLTTIASSCQQLSAAGLVEFYEVDGKKYLQVSKWQERVRSKSKYPDPSSPSASICAQLPADDSNPPAIDSKCCPPTPYALRPTPYALCPAAEPSAPVASLPDGLKNSDQPVEIPQALTLSDSAPEPTKPKRQPQTYHEHARTALHLLNEASGRHFRETDDNLKIISARLAEPDVDIEGIRKMISRQAKMWGTPGNPMQEYLRPSTLFNKSKFDGYYAGKDSPIPETSFPPTKPTRPHPNDFIIPAGTTPAPRPSQEQILAARAARIAEMERLSAAQNQVPAEPPPNPQ